MKLIRVEELKEQQQRFCRCRFNRPVWETIRHLKAGERSDHTVTKSELYKGKKISYHALFEKGDRVTDNKVVCGGV